MRTRELSSNRRAAPRFLDPHGGRAGRSPALGALERVPIWDAPVRVFHWLMVLSFVGAYLTADSERWRLVHNTLGYTMAGLVALRLLWGLIGTRHARFTQFVRGPRAVRRYLTSMLRGKPAHHAGHNPAGALAIVALLGLTLLVALAGWASDASIGPRWLEKLHEPAVHGMLGVVLLHLGGVLVGSWLHRENLVAAMFTGRKLATPAEAIHRAWRGVAALLLAAVLAFWWQQWQSRPAPRAAPDPQHAQAHPASGNSGERGHGDN